MYRIHNWDKHFENNRSRSLLNLTWVRTPNKHDGEGYIRTMRERSGLALYGAWNLILQVASKCTPRGDLVREDGTPHTAESLSIKTSAPQKQMQRALDWFSSPQVQWLEVVTAGASLHGTGVPDDGTIVPTEGREVKGSEGKEEKGGEPARDLNWLDTYSDRAKLIVRMAWLHFYGAELTPDKTRHECLFEAAMQAVAVIPMGQEEAYMERLCKRRKPKAVQSLIDAFTPAGDKWGLKFVLEGEGGAAGVDEKRISDNIDEQTRKRREYLEQGLTEEE